MLPLSFRFVRAGAVQRPRGFDSGWRSFGETLVTQVRGGGYVIRTPHERIAITAGGGFLIPPGLRTRVSVPPGASSVAVFAHLHCRVYELQGLFTVLERPIVFSADQARRVGACNDRLIACQDQADSLAASVEAAACCAELVTLAVAACPRLAVAWSRPERERLLGVLRHVQDHLDQPLEREDLARVAGVSVPHLHTLFQRAFGAAPMAVVRRERMQHARQLLHWSDLPVAEVARRCGFPDPYYFSRAFSREEGVAPSRYRRERREQAG